MGTFDPDKFLAFETEAPNSTSIIPCPIGEWLGVVHKPVEFREIVSQKTGLTYTTLRVEFAVSDPAVVNLTQRDPTIVRYDTFLDLLENGNLDMSQGKNTGLGRLREAAGMNQPGTKFSFPALTGKMMKVRVKHRVDGDNVFDEVSAVARP